MRIVLGAVFVLLTAGCGKTELPPEQGAASGSAHEGAGSASQVAIKPNLEPRALVERSLVEKEALSKARVALDEYTTKLKETLTGAMKEGGPAHAAEVCSVQAQQLSSLSPSACADCGIKLGRASLRLRNPANAGPDWVKQWLARMGERPALGVSAFESVSNDRKSARILRPIKIQEPCLACHGDPKTLDPKIQALLAEKYPDDKATGYSLGDLRGAMWVTAPIELSEQ